MAGYQLARDTRSLPMFEFTCDLARLEPPAPHMQQLLGAVSQRQQAMDGFVNVITGTFPVAEFLAPGNVERIMTGSAAALARVPADR
ncbi:MAG: hypothetical protein ACXV5Q_02520 [Frankiaceae bacterium]